MIHLLHRFLFLTQLSGDGNIFLISIQILNDFFVFKLFFSLEKKPFAL
jgi:hypothetical protein